MRSYEVCECGAPLRPREQPTPQPTGSEVLLQVTAAGVCHSDVHFWEGAYDIGGGKVMRLTDRGVKLPLTLGHENVGRVIAVGPEATDLAIGEERLVYPWIGCGDCQVCRRGDEQLCLTPKFVGVFRPGGFSDYLLVPHTRCLLPIGDIPAEQAAPLACSGLTAYSALKKFGDLLKTEPIVVIGAGGLGLMALAILRAMGARGAIVVDIDPLKREAAMRAGALATIDARASDAPAQIQSRVNGRIWAVADFVGSGATVKLGSDLLTKGGHLVVAGLFGGEVTIPTPFFPMRAMTIQGSYTGSLPELRELMALMRSVPPPFMPIEVRPLARVNETLHQLRDGGIVGRVVLSPQ